ncbi:MAG: hypothetical protein IPP58_12500 [Holophagaceae bacterium]|uniref:Cellobiose phosphorylase n=1 Tax=Candidatus Geothrix skivensis TaxID=2954439 RepID=A0A9D7SJX9_9BACT|nr:hypothetical protein [Candidatus Geothrix skivensis]
MAPFFMSLVSDSDHWLFISSNGALTAGRKDAEHALFPYYTDDRIHDSQDQTGSLTLLRITRRGRTFLWEPFSQRLEGLYQATRSLYKSVYGNKILFEEANHDLGLTFRYAWMNSERFGFVRQAMLANQGNDEVQVQLLDGIQNVLPAGVERRFQVEFSTLVDGYKRTELIRPSGLALFRLSSVPVDKPEPSEALRVNLAWSTGLEPAQRLLSTTQIKAFRLGAAPHEEGDIRGQRGAYLLHAGFPLGGGERKDWLIVAELNQDATAVVALKHRLESEANLQGDVLEDVAKGTRNLLRIVASSDGLQLTGDPLNAQRHFSNTLFNLLRGGVPDDGYRISRNDLVSFLTQSNREVAHRHARFLAQLPDHLQHRDLIDRVTTLGDLDLERLAKEYLPLTFSRRHGDPSRPWNSFSIEVRDEQGAKILNYEGNWRDIFQNWEALGHAFPGFLESMIFKFADCSTVDGHNPYRLMRVGFDWEVSDPQDPWSFIGYWGDHQVIYLLKLLEASHRFDPGLLRGLLDRQIFTYADVPYRIKPYPDMLANPHDTIAFDEAAHEEALKRAQAVGADGLAVPGPHGPVRASLTEKLLLVSLSKLANYVPEAGIWMNTQRPEWNDANNALVGYGVSMVTLYYLRRYLAFCRELLPEAPGGRLEVAVELSRFLEGVDRALSAHPPTPGQAISDRERKQVLDALGQAGTAYRTGIYDSGFSGIRVQVPLERLLGFLEVALQHIDHAIRQNQRPDGLYHSYHVMKVVGDGIAVRPLYEMLEGQVAVLSSGVLSGEQSVAVLDALQSSQLYRADQASYLLYPDRPLPHFLEKNILPDPSVSASPLLTALLATGDERLVTRDVEGRVHFNAAFRNAGLLREALQRLKLGDLRSLVEAEEARLLALYEQVFDHQSFTGRSGTFYKYEGLGCIYWHMVSKLLLAVDETKQRTAGGAPAVAHSLEAHYRAIRDGLGVHKPPALHGAIPIDPYSHTTGFAGAQQPGMTGQVKEDILSRLGEMGVQVSQGRIAFLPWLVPHGEFLNHPASFSYPDVAGESDHLDLEPGSFAFTLCQVPVVVHRTGTPSIRILRRSGSVDLLKELALDAVTSRAIFQRAGEVRRLDVWLGLPA